MHIQRFDWAGIGHNASLCGIVYPSYRTINAPFALGRKVCKHCKAVMAGRRRLAA